MTNRPQPVSRKLTSNVKAGGCAAKLSSAELELILRDLPKQVCAELLTTIENFEDAAVYKLREDLAIVQTIDFFPPVVDDPYLYGQIAATNALSDVYAMGGRPIMALNVLCFPTCDYPLEVVKEILRGGAEQVALAGAVLAGGHSIQSQEPVYGLSVTGVIEPGAVITNGGAQVNDQLVLCKPIGTGVGLLAMKAGLLSQTATSSMINSMTTLSKSALEAGLPLRPSALTDVTGFGLLGHLHEMAKGSALSVRLNADRVPFLPDVLKHAAEGFVPAGAYGNRKSYEQFTTYINDVDLSVADLLFDPQTSGGLLFALDKSRSDELLARLKQAGIDGCVIGEFRQGEAGKVEVVSNE